jgi:peroxiredoxin
VSGLLQPGDPAPEFSAVASDGRVYALRDLLADSLVLLAFYPGNDTPG